MADKTILLVVDDSEIMLAGIAEILEDAGYIVHTETDPDEALEKMKSTLPSLALVDVILGPKKSGFELCRNIRRTFDARLLGSRRVSRPVNRATYRKTGNATTREETDQRMADRTAATTAAGAAGSGNAWLMN